MKTEALKLADWLDKSIDADDWGELAKYYQWCHENVSPMIRRLVEELDKQSEPVAWMDKNDKTRIQTVQEWADDIPLYTTPQTKPLSDEEIAIIAEKFWVDGSFDDGYLDDIGFARAIEERHGIK